MKVINTKKLRSLSTHLTALLLMSLLLNLSGCATQKAKDASDPVTTTDFPTLATVEYVLGCMNSKGEQTYTTMYQCTCRFDELAKQLSYDEYNQAVVFRNLRSMPGDNGGAFRDHPQAKIMRDKLKNAEAAAKASCEPS